MVMADVASIVVTVFAALVAMPCIALMFAAFFPEFARRAEARVERRPILTFVVGLVVAGVAMAFVAVLAQGPAPLKFLSAVFGLGAGWAAISGWAGIAGRIGHALPSPIDRDRPWRAIVRGAVILELACVFPGVGWVLIYPVSLVMGMGAAALSLIPAGAPQPVSQADPATARLQQAMQLPVATFSPPPAPVPNAVFAASGPEQAIH
jgi:hypothetical protein